MHVLVIGSGGREHAMVDAIAASPLLTMLSVAPGNAGTADYNVELGVDDHPAVIAWCSEHNVDLVVVGPEVPLVAGLADALTTAKIACFGPSQAAAQLEGSKAFTRRFAERHGIPSPACQAFTSTAQAVAWVDASPFEVVVKADGLAAGKGVIIPESRAETIAAIESMLDGGAFGAAGETIVLEERIQGEELSLFGISDGAHIIALGTAQDHKRVGDGDTGPNTGGMGAFSPVPGIDGDRQAELAAQFLQPVVDGMAAEGTPYVGIVFAGIMLTNSGPKLIEYNCRFGDPECQVVLPRLRVDVLALFDAAARGRLNELDVAADSETLATVVVCADGYPASPRKGVPISLPAIDVNTVIFHAGTGRTDAGQLVSTGGRVLSVVGRGADLDIALKAAYSVVDQITGDGLFARRDIGWRHSNIRSSR